MNRHLDTGPTPGTRPNTGPDDDRHTRETLALIADRIRNGTVPASPKPEHPTGSKA